MYNPSVILGVELEVEVENNPDSIVRHVSEYVIQTARGMSTRTSEHVKHGNIIRTIDKLGGGFITTGHDGSLRDGIEMRGEPATIIENKMKWAPIFEMKEIKYLVDRPSAGMHVHLSGDPISPLILAKMVRFINDPTNEILITNVAGRYNGRYCGINHNHKITDVVSMYHTSECRGWKGKKKTPANTPVAPQNLRAMPWREGNYSFWYGAAETGEQIMCSCITCTAGEDYYSRTHGGLRERRRTNIIHTGNGELVVENACCKGAAKSIYWLRGAINVVPREGTGVCEIRMFSSTVNKERFFSNLEFCVALVDFCHFTPIPKLSTEDFKNFMELVINRVKYPNLYRHLRSAGFTVNKIPTKTTFCAMLTDGKAKNIKSSVS